jgi:hypothetical protein
MKRIIILFLSILGLCVSCTRPMDGDFGFQQLGLGDDEFLWVLRLSQNASGAEPVPTTPEDSLAVDQISEALFAQMLPRLVRDILNDSIKAFEDYEFIEEEKEIVDFPGRMYEMGITKQNFASLLHTFDLLAVVKSGKGKANVSYRYLRLVWHDPEGRRPDRNFACVRFSDLEKMKYTLTTETGTLKIGPVMREMRFHYFPVHLRNNAREYSTQSPEEARYLVETVMSGNWDKVRFIDDAINISGVNKIPMPSKVLSQYSGAYSFGPDSLWKYKTLLYLTVEQDHLVADWVHRTEPEKIYAYFENAYFSPRGEFYLFPEEEDTTQQRLLFVIKGDTTTGNREQRL